MAAVMSIKRTYEKHRQENPGSMLSERAIRLAVKNGNLPSINAGSKKLVCDVTFEMWLKGQLAQEAK